MEIINYNENYLSDIVRLWNEEVVEHSIYKSLDETEFKIKVVQNEYFKSDGFKILIIDNKCVGYAHAITTQASVGFITSIVIKKAYQRQGYGTLLLKECENYIKNKGINVIRLYFASPINFEWFIPNTLHLHPGAPAVEVDSPFYYLLVNNGYEVNGQMDGYHLDLTKYNLDKQVIEKEKENQEKGYNITYYDSKIHYGFEDLFKALKNEGWQKAVSDNLKLEKPYPMLIIEKDNEILGWIGPLYTQTSKRAYLAGIGVHPKVQGMGLGKCLFCEFCYRSKLNGSEYITLFTGIDNKARNIYLYAGLKIVKSFVILRKELK